MKSLLIPNYKLKVKNSDFKVKEISFLPVQLTKADSLYSYLLIEKEGLSTFQLLDVLANTFNVPSNDVSASGLKDEQAITVQVISIKTIVNNYKLGKLNAKFCKEKYKIKICSILGYGRKPVLPKMLHGNEFEIKVRNVNPKVARGVEDALKENKFQGFINYYDEQRFGKPDSYHNTHLIGKYLLSKSWRKAYKEYLLSGNDGEEREKVKQKFFDTSSYEKAIGQVGDKKKDFFISSYNSYLWNQKLSNIISFLKNSYEVDFPFLGKFSLPSKRADGVPFFLTVDSFEYDWHKRLKKKVHKTRPVYIVVPVYMLRCEKDKFFSGKKALTLSFVLPTGCYATMFIKQLLINSSY